MPKLKNDEKSKISDRQTDIQLGKLRETLAYKRADSVCVAIVYKCLDLISYKEGRDTCILYSH